MRYIAERLAANRRSNNELNPVLFDERDQLKPEIREKIMSIVDEFLEYIEVDIRVIDVRLLGSNAAYNYTDDSDIDIHIITDLSKISDPESIARLYFDASKKNFKDSYDITIKGIEVELYVEDIKASAVSNGVYSVTKSSWIKEPTPLGEPSDAVIAAAERIEDQFIQSVKETRSIEELEALVDQLYLTRKDSLAEDGELGAGNLAFKSLRSKGILGQIKDTIKDATSERLSLESKNNQRDSSSYYES